MEGEGSHLPVLLDEVTFLLRPRRGGWVVDGTIGMGGHAERLLEVSDERTRLLGLDRDPEALRRAALRLQRFGGRVTLRQGSFRDIAAHAQEAGVAEAAAILLDLGLSSYQLEVSGRGFSFQHHEPLDMRFDPGHGRTAADLLARLSETELARILFEHGEERQARRTPARLVAPDARRHAYVPGPPHGCQRGDARAAGGARRGARAPRARRPLGRHLVPLRRGSRSEARLPCLGRAWLRVPRPFAHDAVRRRDPRQSASQEREAPRAGADGGSLACESRYRE